MFFPRTIIAQIHKKGDAEMCKNTSELDLLWGRWPRKNLDKNKGKGGGFGFDSWDRT